MWTGSRSLRELQASYQQNRQELGVVYAPKRTSKKPDLNFLAPQHETKGKAE